MSQLSKLSLSHHHSGAKGILRIVREIKQAKKINRPRSTPIGGGILTKRVLSNLQQEMNLVLAEAKRMH
jgi:hypothetical protein